MDRIDRLIREMQYAHDIHKRWIGYQRTRLKTGKKPLPNAGGILWHKRWCKTYKEVIKVLRQQHG